MNEEKKLLIGINQVKYLFTSWTKFFESIKEKPTFIVPMLFIIGLILISTIFAGDFGEQTIEAQRAVFEEYFDKDIYAGVDKEQLVETSLNNLRNQYRVIPYTITTTISVLIISLLVSLLLQILKLIFKGEGTYYSLFITSLSINIFTHIYNIIYFFIGTITGTLVDIFSLGIFVSYDSEWYILLNTISVYMIISFAYYYFAGKVLLNLSKVKSILFSGIIIMIPVLVSLIINTIL